MNSEVISIKLISELIIRYESYNLSHSLSEFIVRPLDTTCSNIATDDNDDDGDALNSGEPKKCCSSSSVIQSCKYLLPSTVPLKAVPLVMGDGQVR